MIKKLAAVSAALALPVLMLASPASANVGVSTDGRVTGGATFVTEPAVGSNNIVIDFACTVVGVGAVAARFEPGNCVLKKGGVAVGSAPGIFSNVPATATSARVPVSLLTPGLLEVCYKGEVFFSDGTSAVRQACTTDLVGPLQG